MDTEVAADELHSIRARLESLAEETGDDVLDLAVKELVRTRRSLRHRRAAMRQAGLDVRGSI